MLYSLESLLQTLIINIRRRLTSESKPTPNAIDLIANPAHVLTKRARPPSFVGTDSPITGYKVRILEGKENFGGDGKK
jgi:hypothetical protein